jgi:hypothetical protein
MLTEGKGRACGPITQLRPAFQADARHLLVMRLHAAERKMAALGIYSRTANKCRYYC